MIQVSCIMFLKYWLISRKPTYYLIRPGNPTLIEQSNHWDIDLYEPGSSLNLNVFCSLIISQFAALIYDLLSFKMIRSYFLDNSAPIWLNARWFFCASKNPCCPAINRAFNIFQVSFHVDVEILKMDLNLKSFTILTEGYL